MKINSKREQRNYIIVGLCAVLVIMGVGYAAFSQLLTINGTANISNSWCVGFDNTKTNAYTPKAGITGATAPTGSMSYSGTACESTLQPASSLTAHFYQPGDEIEYTLTIVNKSTVTAAIKSILVDNESVTSNTTKTKNNITYIVNMPESTTLAPNASTTMKVIARFQNETDVTGNVSGQTETIEVKINAEQDDGNGGMDITPASNKFTGHVYARNKNHVAIGDSINAESVDYWTHTEEYEDDGEIYTDYYEDYDKEEDCLNAVASRTGHYCTKRTKVVGLESYTTNSSEIEEKYYLKYDVVDDIITKSYVCFLMNNQEKCLKPGLDNFDENMQVFNNYKNYYNLGIYSSPDDENVCDINGRGETSMCRGGEFKYLEINSGDVSVGDFSNYCVAGFDGISSCRE